MPKAINPHKLENHNYTMVPLHTTENGLFLWHSLCSAHRAHNIYCDMCNVGSWEEIEYAHEQIKEKVA